MKRWCSYLLTLALVLSFAPFAAAAGEAQEEVTVTILFNTTNTLRPAMETTKVWDYIREQTGIRFEVLPMQGDEQVQLMFASRDYPDMIAVVGATNTQLAQAAEAGDLVDLGPYLEEYAPTWAKFFAENPIIYNMERINGGLYTLPFVAQTTARTLRDQWLYISTWLTELGLEVPTTTQAFKDVLLAIQQAAGTGTIPADVVPYYYLYDNYIGGQFDVYGSFGVPVTNADYLIVDREGQVVYQAVNPQIKDALKYLQELYALGLTPAESFTDDWNSYLSKTSSNPPIIFSYHSAANRLPSVTLPMAAPSCGLEGRETYIRPQALTANPIHATAIFSKCEHVERIVQFFEWATEYENSMTLLYGLEGVVWDYDAQDRYALNFWETSVDRMNENAESLGFNNSWFNLQTKDFCSTLLVDPDESSLTSKVGAIKQIYAAQLPDWDCVYLSGALNEDDTTIMNELTADLKQIQTQTFAKWITTNADIDAEWDAYVKRIEDAGLAEWLAFKQAAYDLLSGT